MPAVGQEFQSLLPLGPEQRLERVTPADARQVYPWVHDLSYTDAQKRPGSFTAIPCQETVGEQTTTWAWITAREVTARTVCAVATKGGRHRWHLENQGFNTQKNSGFNLEHASSHRYWQAFSYLLQIAPLIWQLLEKGSLLRRLAQELGQTPVQLFGSLKNIARRLLDSLRATCGLRTRPMTPLPQRVFSSAWIGASRRWLRGWFGRASDSAASGSERFWLTRQPRSRACFVRSRGTRKSDRQRGRGGAGSYSSQPAPTPLLLTIALAREDNQVCYAR